MNFNNKRTRRIVSIVVLIVIIAMVATMIIPYLVYASYIKKSVLPSCRHSKNVRNAGNEENKR